VVTGADLVGSEDMLDTYGYRAENRAFIDAVRSGRQPECHLGDHLALVEACERIAAGAHHTQLRDG